MTAAADARRAAIVARAMAREGLSATLTKPGQAGPGSGVDGGFSAESWDVLVIRLPLELRARDANSTLAEADGRVVVQSYVHLAADIHDFSSQLPVVVVDTFGKAFLGMTMECARCHDHKYDPISQKDYYQTYLL